MAHERFDLLRWLGADTAADHLVCYLHKYTGAKFEQLADRDPYRFTQNDIVAVSMLSVAVPASASIWLLSEDGQRECTKLLERIPADVPIWDYEPDLLSLADAPLVQLWTLLTSPDAQWPQSDSANGIGAVIAGKLLATKRPHLVPIYDDVVSTALGSYSSGHYWRTWQASMSDEVREQADLVRRQAAGSEPSANNLSLLRVADIVIWMSNR